MSDSSSSVSGRHAGGDYSDDDSLSSQEDSGFSSSGYSSSDAGSGARDSSSDYSSSDDEGSFQTSDSDSASSDVVASSDDDDDGSPEDLDFEAKHARALKKWGVNTQESEKTKTAKPKVKKQARTDLGKDGAAEAVVRESLVRRTWSEEVDGLNEEEILVKLRELTASRQKRSGERADQLRQAQLHARERNMKQVYIEALRAVIGIGLDLSASICLSVNQWTNLANDICTLYAELCADEKLTFASNEGSPAAAAAGYVDCLQTNLTKGIKSTDSYSEEYKERIKLLPLLHATLLINHAYLIHAEGQDALVGRCLVSLVAQTYYMTDLVAAERWETVFALVPEICHQKLGRYFTYQMSETDSNSVWVRRVIEDVIKRNLPDLETTFAGLCYYVQNAAVNGRVDEAREVIANTPLCDLAQTLEASSQIHYNRAICQIGLAAFRQGNFQLAASYLNDICLNNKQRELLAQGLSSMLMGGRDGRVNDSGRSEQEKLERKRLLPVYLHLNLDLIESALNIYAILNSRSVRFRRILDYTEKSFIPPETSREIVFACGRKLYNGEYHEACRLIKSLRFWQTYDDGMQGLGTAASVQEKIFEKFRELALICYFQRYAQVYESFSAADLAAMFDLTPAGVYALVSRMVLKKEVNASWDAKGEILYISQNLSTPLQALTHTTLKNVDAPFETITAAS